MRALKTPTQLWEVGTPLRQQDTRSLEGNSCWKVVRVVENGMVSARVSPFVRHNVDSDGASIWQSIPATSRTA
jgi:hypothetical protein